MKRLILLLLFFVTCSVASYGQITFSSLTEISDGSVDTSAQIVLVNPTSNIPVWRGSVGELLKAISRVGAVIATGSIIDGTITDADIASGADIGIEKLDTTSADGVVSKSRLSNALDDVGSGGSGDASGRSIQTITADGTDTLDFGGLSYATDYWQIDLNAVTTSTINFTNPNTSIVPTYNIHFTNANTDTVIFASTFIDANLDTITRHVFEQGQIVPVYYYNSDYYTNYLTISTSGGGGSSSQDTITKAEPEYAAILAYSSTNSYTMPDTATQRLQNTLVDSLKTIGVWDSIEFMYVFTHNEALSDFSLVNWKDPSQYEATNVNTTISATGATNSQGDEYISTNWDFLNDASVVTNTSASVFYMISDQPDAVDREEYFGLRDGGSTDSLWFTAYTYEASGKMWIRPALFSTVSFDDNHNVNVTDVPVNNNVICHASNGTNNRSYVDGTIQGSAEDISAKQFNDFTSDDFYISGRNYGGTAEGHPEGNNIRFIILGNIIDPDNIDRVSSVLKTYTSSL
jgi:hypothetical protein